MECMQLIPCSEFSFLQEDRHHSIRSSQIYFQCKLTLYAVGARASDLEVQLPSLRLSGTGPCSLIPIHVAPGKPGLRLLHTLDETANAYSKTQPKSQGHSIHLNSATQ